MKMNNITMFIAQNPYHPISIFIGIIFLLALPCYAFFWFKGIELLTNFLDSFFPSYSRMTADRRKIVKLKVKICE